MNPDDAKIAMDHVPHVIPFMMAATGGGVRVDNGRVMEAIIIAVVSGAVIAGAGYFIALPVLQEQIGRVRYDIQDIREEMRRNRDDIERRANRRDTKEAVTDSRINKIEIDMARRGR